MNKIASGWIGSCALIWIAATCSAGAMEFRCAPGDVLDFAVAGFPELRRSVPIDPDGTISLPFVGELKASGRTLADLRGEVRARLSQNEVTQRPAGSTRSGAYVIWPEQVSLTVSEFRPVYLNGDVAKPGELKFRPGMTVRQALSLAGGYDILRFRMDNPFIESSGLRGDYEAAWIDYAREKARLDRLQTEFGEPIAKAKADLDPPLSPDVIGRIRDAENLLLKTRENDFRDKEQHFSKLLAQYEVNVEMLTRESESETGAAQYDESELNRVTGLNKQGVLPLSRVIDERRLVLLSASRALQTGVALERVKTEQEIARRQIEAVRSDRRKDILSAAQDAQVKIETLRTRIQAIGDKLVYVGALRTQLARGDADSVILRLFRGNLPPTLVGEDTELRAGDVVEVALRSPSGPSSEQAVR